MDGQTQQRQTRFSALVVLVLLSSQCCSQVTDTVPQEPSELEDNVCSGGRTCGDCTAIDPSCGWCTQQGFTEDTGFLRCDLIQNLINKTCLNITYPVSSVIIEENEELRDADEVLGDPVQVAPQKIRLKLRPGESVNLSVSVRQARDYPVDLYYVMDLSRSMWDDLDNLKELADTIATEMGEITRNFRLGFGSFVEKTLSPFTNTTPSSILEPCPGCQPTYNFINHLPLDVDTSLFSEKVRETIVSRNIDSPEAGLDALMQITVCKDLIGWLPKARHIIIYTSDDIVHIAGDGKLLGITVPNDGECHLNSETGFNDRANEFDYPSFGRLSIRMREHNVIPIFAVTVDHIDVYEALTNFVEGSTVGVLYADSSNVVDLIKDNYAKITSKVEISDNAPENLAVTYTSHCLNEAPNPGSKVCMGLKLDETVSFDVTVEATSCHDNTEQSFTIGPIGFDEVLEVAVEVICSCDCEDLSIANSDYCSNGNGTLSCGQCVCDAGRYGKLCECSSGEDTEVLFRDKYKNVASCRASSNSSIACSGRGECICGECACFERMDKKEVISGRFCECDNFSCERYNGELCGGAVRGQCVCDEKSRRSVCKCKPGFSGDACDCSISTAGCVASNGLLCNANGVCECNRCKCDANSAFKGSTCELCKTCFGKCSSYRPCVECKIFGSDVISPEECDKCKVVVVIDSELPNVNVSNLCVFPGGFTNCSTSYNFVYKTLDNGTVLVHLQDQPRVCDPNGDGSGMQPTVVLASSVDILLLVLGIVVGIVLIGVILVSLLRLATYLLDKREYARFEKEQQAAVWDEGVNPLYKPSTSKYINPVYAK
ncbi:integrin beta-1-like [Asterias rubens]|uniref:integrin beta-1-like n=1 Tax=Asterias rubens TaxID=7604 RepID=UPI001455C84A|nr:integrin beta-1-like [Asterias rubens]